MTTISPTRVSMYDFLYQDTKPLVSLLADAAALSLPQARLAMDASLQAIISALLAYQQRHQGQALSKKLFGRSAVKEMRQYNSMNFATLNTTLYHRHDAADAIFHDNARVSKASEYIAAQIDATAPQVQILLTTLCVIVLRELAILVEYSQLDHDEVNKWFALQPQFLSKARFATPVSNLALNESADDSDESQTTLSAIEAVKIQSVASDERYLLIAEQLTDNPPAFDPYWYELTAFIPEQFEPVKDVQLATGNYLKAIGRSAENIQQGKHNDLLMFAPMTAIGLPHQRWLVQLAKISEIYLQRNRLRITSEPINPPKPPLVSSGLLSSNSNNDNTPSTLSEKPIEYEASVPLWKNPVILLIILVIGGLGILATIKYQTQKANGVVLATNEVLAQDSETEERKQQDVAIVMVDDDIADDDISNENTKSKPK
ncbi:hypothetical protein SC65A3_00665 [Psychrobacter sp. SC65A.3]|uniref:hypothetical protein n=1 Tax=Psychrobacter sp. SC65A.3 TaxID=2983299 RepID=UPI0021DB443A|nr:hypothetical protein [Psychrobacter sp. SC65A.3]WAI87213.1 hypothetical protein SC65A3_00665 [Psychrobacter sp. SC65A.3]